MHKKGLKMENKEMESKIEKVLSGRGIEIEEYHKKAVLKELSELLSPQSVDVEELRKKFEQVTKPRLEMASIIGQGRYSEEEKFVEKIWQFFLPYLSRNADSGEVEELINYIPIALEHLDRFAPTDEEKKLDFDIEMSSVLYKIVKRLKALKETK
jgi:hypothetical protein